jgi:hypothetical protein
LDIKNQEAFYRENVNLGDVLWGMPVLASSVFFSETVMNLKPRDNNGANMAEMLCPVF